jgi:hypothetical protein
MKIKIKINEKCPVCHFKIPQIIKLPKFPITEFNINYKKKIDKKFYKDQAYLYCENCCHLTLKNLFDSKYIYSNYYMTSSKSFGATQCLKNFYKFIQKDIHSNKSSIIDIGGNDSTFLKFFKNKLRVNIDPNASTNDKKIIIYREYFDNISFAKFKTSYQNIYVSSHTLEHLENPIKLLENLSEILSDQDLIFLQIPCMEEFILKSRFDQTCHQHINLFSLYSLNKVLEKINLFINCYEYDETHFGTLRVKISKKNNNTKIKKIRIGKSLIKDNFRDFRNYYAFLDGQMKKYVINNLQGYGAGILTPVLAYFLPCLKNLKYIFDDNNSKYNLKYITMNPVIKNIKYIDKKKPVIITSISSRYAIRSILKKLTLLGCENIIIPSKII